MTPRTTPSDLLIRQQLRTLARALPEARKGVPARIHEARVATRRLRERLPLVVTKAAGRKLMRRVRRLSRALGAVRELDVALETLREVRAGDGPAAAVDRLTQLIGRERQRLYAAMCDEVARSDVEKLRRAVAAGGRGGTPSAADDPKRQQAARAQAARRAVRLRAAIDGAAGLYLPDRLHEVRIAVKKLRYALELVHDVRGARAARRLATLKDAQDLLGRMHDLEVLIGRVRAVQGTSGADERMSADLERLVRRFETECRQLHGQYMAMRKRLVAVCRHTLKAAEAGAAGRRASPAA